MEISKNKTKIERSSISRSQIAVCGLGYVGFPVALLFARAGFRVTGVDVNQDKIKKINRGGNPIKGNEPGLNELVRQVSAQGRSASGGKKSSNFSATTDPLVYQDADVIIVAVETPVEANHQPSYSALKSALEDIGQNIREGVLIIIESTISPGTMVEIVQPILEQESGLETDKPTRHASQGDAGGDFQLVNCPERLMPGHLLENIENYNRVLGGEPKATKLAKSLYKHIVKGEIRETDWITAEIVKAGENAYRDVQIAFANEMALLCEAMGADVWRVRELINDCKRRGETRPEALRQMHCPGAGVGGHCIPKDSWLLVYGAKNRIEPKIIPLARHINDFMPRHVFHLLKDAYKEVGKPIINSKIVILGYAYAGNSDDSRNTPTKSLIELLNNIEAKYVIHDAYVKEYKTPLEATLKNTQAVVLMADHDQYRKINLSRLRKLMKAKPIIIDGRNCFDKEKAKKLGFMYKGVGNI